MAMSPLEIRLIPEASTMLQNIEQGREILFEWANSKLFREIVIGKEPGTFDEAWNHDVQKARGNGEMPLKRSLVIWISNKFGRSLRNRIFQRIEKQSNLNGSSR
jgi:hypothetical protein